MSLRAYTIPEDVPAGIGELTASIYELTVERLRKKGYLVGSIEYDFGLKPSFQLPFEAAFKVTDDYMEAFKYAVRKSKTNYNLNEFDIMLLLEIIREETGIW